MKVCLIDQGPWVDSFWVPGASRGFEEGDFA